MTLEFFQDGHKCRLALCSLQKSYRIFGGNIVGEPVRFWGANCGVKVIHELVLIDSSREMEQCKLEQGFS